MTATRHRWSSSDSRAPARRSRPDPFVFPRADTDPATTITPALLREIIGWLAQNFDLPASDALPNVAFTTTARMDALRYPGLLTATSSARPAATPSPSMIPRAAPSICRKAGAARRPRRCRCWCTRSSITSSTPRSCRTPARRSARSSPIGRRSAGCGASTARSSSEFGTDGFTLLVRTSCGF